MASFPEAHPARAAYGTVNLSTERTRSSILTGAAAQLRLFADADVAWLTAKQQDSLDALVDDGPEARFLIIPDDKSTRYPLVTLYLTQLFQVLTERTQQHGGHLPRPVHILLDEFGNLPSIPDFDKTVTVAAGRGMNLVMVLQDLQQLKARYGEDAHTIQGNARTWVYLATQDFETAQVLSRKMGEYTTHLKTFSQPHVSWWRPLSVHTGSVQESHGLIGRPLLTPDEILRWPEGQALVLQARVPPARLTLPDLSDWSCFLALHRGRWDGELKASGDRQTAAWWPGQTSPVAKDTSMGLVHVWAKSRNRAPPDSVSVPDW